MLENLVSRALKFRLRRPKMYDMARARSKTASDVAPPPRRSSLLRRRLLHPPPPIPGPQVVYEDAVCVALRTGGPRQPLQLLLLPRHNAITPLQHDEVLSHMVVTGARLGQARAGRSFKLQVEGAGGGVPLRVHVNTDWQE